MFVALGASLVVFAVVVHVLNSSLRRKGQNLPPGPPGLPIFGNLWDLPRPDQPEWEFYSKHKDLYGKAEIPPSSTRFMVLDF